MFIVTNDCGVATIRTTGMTLLMVDHKAVAAEQDGTVYLFPIWDTSWRVKKAAAQFVSTLRGVPTKASWYSQSESAYTELQKAILSGAVKVLSPSEYSVLSLTLSVG